MTNILIDLNGFWTYENREVLIVESGADDDVWLMKTPDPMNILHRGAKPIINKHNTSHIHGPDEVASMARCETQ